MSNIKEAQFVFDDHSFRIGAMYWLAACNDGESLPDDLIEAFDDGCLDDLWGERDSDEAAWWLASTGKRGFLARVETPAPSILYSDGGYGTYGWGMYACEWVYAETLEELLAEAGRVSNAYIEKRLNILRKKKEGKS